MWKEASGARVKQAASPYTYEALVELGARSEEAGMAAHREQVAKDLPRTFPDLPAFSSGRETLIGLRAGEERAGELLQGLRRVLEAYCARNPETGYVQGMNFIAALLLLVLPEADAFWVFAAVVEHYLPGPPDPPPSRSLALSQPKRAAAVLARGPLLRWADAGYYEEGMGALQADLRVLHHVLPLPAPPLPPLTPLHTQRHPIGACGGGVGAAGAREAGGGWAAVGAACDPLVPDPLRRRLRARRR
eukprot:2434542-Rhodomonas_salina.1